MIEGVLFIVVPEGFGEAVAKRLPMPTRSLPEFEIWEEAEHWEKV